MKPYGNSPAKNRTCVYGCCSTGAVKTKHRPHVDKAYIRRSRKTARRLGKKATAGD